MAERNPSPEEVLADIVASLPPLETRLGDLAEYDAVNLLTQDEVLVFLCRDRLAAVGALVLDGQPLPGIMAKADRLVSELSSPSRIAALIRDENDCGVAINLAIVRHDLEAVRREIAGRLEDRPGQPDRKGMVEVLDDARATPESLAQLLRSLTLPRRPQYKGAGSASGITYPIDPESVEIRHSLYSKVFGELVAKAREGLPPSALEVDKAMGAIAPFLVARLGVAPVAMRFGQELHQQLQVYGPVLSGGLDSAPLKALDAWNGHLEIRRAQKRTGEERSIDEAEAVAGTSTDASRFLLEVVRKHAPNGEPADARIAQLRSQAEAVAGPGGRIIIDALLEDRTQAEAAAAAGVTDRTVRNLIARLAARHRLIK